MVETKEKQMWLDVAKNLSKSKWPTAQDLCEIERRQCIHDRGRVRRYIVAKILEKTNRTEWSKNTWSKAWIDGPHELARERQEYLEGKIPQIKINLAKHYVRCIDSPDASAMSPDPMAPMTVWARIGFSGKEICQCESEEGLTAHQLTNCMKTIVACVAGRPRICVMAVYVPIAPRHLRADVVFNQVTGTAEDSDDENYQGNFDNNSFVWEDERNQ